MKEVPIWHKVALTVEEASAYSNIGVNTLNELIKKGDCNFIFYVGNKRLIKKSKFDDFILNATEIPSGRSL